MTALRTLGQYLEDEQIVPSIAVAATEIRSRATQRAKVVGKSLRQQVSCTHCTAPKGCCSEIVIARLYEGVLIADRLRRAGRDTPTLRDELATRAIAMEAALPDGRTPCAFLGADERCTVYDVRPTACGMLQIYTDPTWCTTRAGEIQGYDARDELAAANQLEDMFRDHLTLRKKVGRRYAGVLPRMVLVALEAWDRTDFRDYLRLLPWPGDAELARWSRHPAPTPPTP